MTDIVETARQLAADIDLILGRCVIVDRLIELAAEIKRLRAEVATAVLAEREACALLCFFMASKWRETGMTLHEQRAIGQEQAAAAIRARTEKE